MSALAGIDIITAMGMPQLFGPWFKGESWNAWRSCLKAIFALEMDEEELLIYQKCTERNDPLLCESLEIWLPIGRRGGKSIVMSMVASWLAIFRSYKEYIAPGEVPTILILGCDKDQARVILGYVKSMLSEIKAFAPLIEQEDKDGVKLKNGSAITIVTASYRAVRGRTIVATICDEIAFWRQEESVSPDVDVLNAIRPAMATIPNAKLICISSPYARRGAMWQAYKSFYGVEDSKVLVFKAPTAVMNPTISAEWLASEYERDPVSAAAEYGAEFRTDIESYIAQEVLDAVTIPGRTELGYVNGAHSYRAFCDPSGGSSDSFTIAIAHREGDTGVLDAVRERKPPFSPQAVIEEFCALLKSYHISSVMGDRYGGEFPRELFRNEGVTYELATMPASDYYRELLPLLSSRKVEL